MMLEVTQPKSSSLDSTLDPIHIIFLLLMGSSFLPLPDKLQNKWLGLLFLIVITLQYAPHTWTFLVTLSNFKEKPLANLF